MQASAGASSTISNDIAAAGDPIFAPAAGTTLTITGVISDATPPAPLGQVSMQGQGTLLLEGSNTYSGGTSVQSGTLEISGSGTLGASSGSTTVSGGTLDLGGTNQTQNGGLTLTSGGVQNGMLTSSGTFALQSGQMGAILTGTGGLTKTGAGAVNLRLLGANAYTGATTVNGGTLGRCFWGRTAFQRPARRRLTPAARWNWAADTRPSTLSNFQAERWRKAGSPAP